MTSTRFSKNEQKLFQAGRVSITSQVLFTIFETSYFLSCTSTYSLFDIKFVIILRVEEFYLLIMWEMKKNIFRILTVENINLINNDDNNMIFLKSETVPIHPDIGN